MIGRLKSALLCAAAMAGLFALSGTVRAATFTYSLFAGPGSLGGTSLSGSITIDGNAGDPFTLTPALTNVDSFNFEWNFGMGVVDWNFGDLVNTVGEPVDFSGVLGDPVLVPIPAGNFVGLETIAFTFPVALELGFGGPTPEWLTGILPNTILDVGVPWQLGVGVPLPSGFAMGLAGMGSMMVIRMAQSRRRRRVKISG